MRFLKHNTLNAESFMLVKYDFLLSFIFQILIY